MLKNRAFFCADLKGDGKVNYQRALMNLNEYKIQMDEVDAEIEDLNGE